MFDSKNFYHFSIELILQIDAILTKTIFTFSYTKTVFRTKIISRMKHRIISVRLQMAAKYLCCFPQNKLF